jgi:hypothetical protein
MSPEILQADYTLERATYERHRPELERYHYGQAALIRGSELVGVFADVLAAAAAGYHRFGRDRFLVREIGDGGADLRSQDMHWSAEEPGSRPSRRHWPDWLSWPTLAAIGLLAYELTAQAALGAVVACAKFGWNDLLTALWLRRTDPRRGRGRTCFWLFLASGLWKVAIAATVVLFATVVIARPQRVPQGAPAGAGAPVPVIFIASCQQAFVGFVLCSLATAVAFGSAWRHQVKLWLHPDVHRARREGFWPPLSARSDRSNQAVGLLQTSLILAIVPCCLAVIVPLSSVVKPGGPIMWISMLLMIGLPAIGILLLKDQAEKRLLARIPADCWDLAEEPDGSST